MAMGIMNGRAIGGVDMPCVANQFSETTAYVPGDYVLYGGSLFKCISANNGPFDVTKWRLTNAMAENNEINSNLTELENAKVVYNPTTDKLDVYSGGVLVGSLNCGFQFDGVLFDSGKVSAYGFTPRTIGSGGSATQSATTLALEASGGSSAYYHTSKKVDLTNYTKLYVTVTCSGTYSSSYLDFGVTDDSFNYTTTKTGSPTKGTEGTLWVDITSVVGEHYLQIGTQLSSSVSGNRIVNVKKMWLEGG